MAGQASELPEPIHRTGYRVLYGDTDAGGVVYYANYLRYFEHGRTEYMRDLVTSYRELESQGYILPVVECYCRYKASAFYDDLLLIETALAEVKPVSCRFTYRILREPDGKLLAAGSTLHAAVHRDGKLARLPAEILEKLSQISGKRA